MKRKRYNRGNLLIDLTSLLDVVFIVLAIVLCNQQNQSEVLKTAEVQLNQEMETLKLKQNEVSVRERQAAEREEAANSQYELYRDQLAIEDNLQQYVLPISINVGYITSDMKERKIHVLIGGEEKPEQFYLKEENTEDFIRFEQELEKCIREHEDMPVILSLNEDDEKILWRDENKIKEIFEKLGNVYDNVYEKNG